jgi:hypothetical protein
MGEQEDTGAAKLRMAAVRIAPVVWHSNGSVTLYKGKEQFAAMAALPSATTPTQTVCTHCGYVAEIQTIPALQHDYNQGSVSMGERETLEALSAWIAERIRHSRVRAMGQDEVWYRARCVEAEETLEQLTAAIAAETAARQQAERERDEKIACRD